MNNLSKVKFNSIRIDMAADVVMEEQLSTLTNMTKNSEKKLAIKICGCEAVTDIYIAKRYNTNSIIAPMIETDYALRKFVEACKFVYSKQLDEIELYINIETLTAYNNLDTILKSQYLQYISGIVLGRDDMAKSMNINLEEINSEKMLKIVGNIAQRVSNYHKKFILGGQIRPQAVPFIMQIPRELLSGYETRMITFNTDSMDEKQITENIKTALKFEIDWLELKEKNKTDSSISYKERIENLKKYL